MTDTAWIILFLSVAVISFLALSVHFLFVIEGLKLEIQKLQISLRHAKEPTND